MIARTRAVERRTQASSAALCQHSSAMNQDSIVPLAAATTEQLESAIRELGGRFLRVARRFFGCEADCADALQDAYLSALRQLATFRGTCRLEISRNMPISTGKTHISQVIGPPTGPRSSNGPKTPLIEGQTSATDVDQDLSRVINAWHSLAEPIRRAILALIGVASN